MSTRVLGLTTLTESQAGKFRTVNGALYFLDALLGSVISRESNGPPGSPTEGDAYIVDDATGDWSGFTVGDIVVYYEDSAGTAAWLNVSPPSGPQIKVDDEDVYVTWTGGDWQVIGAALSKVDVSSSKSLAASEGFSFQNVTAAATITIEPSATVAFPLMSPVVIFRNTSDAVTVTAGAGVTFLGSATLASQNDSLEVMRLESDTWVVRS